MVVILRNEQKTRRLKKWVRALVTKSTFTDQTKLWAHEVRHPFWSWCFDLSSVNFQQIYVEICSLYLQSRRFTENRMMEQCPYWLSFLSTWVLVVFFQRANCYPWRGECVLPFPRSHVVYHLDEQESIDVDGKLDDEAWTRVSWTEEFIGDLTLFLFNQVYSLNYMSGQKTLLALFRCASQYKLRFLPFQ